MSRHSNTFIPGQRTYIVGLAVAVAVGLLGILVLRLSSAETSLVSAEAEAGKLIGSAVTVDDGAASGGKAVRFQAGQTGSHKPGFVYRDGRNLMLDGQVWRFVGVNNYDLTGCHTGSPASEADTDAFFASLRPGSLTRVWAFKEFGADGIARTVQAAERHGQKVMLVLADGAEFCNSPDFDTAWYTDGYKGEYLDWVDTLTQQFKDSPAVGAWEIMNESGHKADVSVSIMKSFLDTAAARIKSNDPNHLVSSGTLAPYEFGGAAEYQTLHSGPDIDMVSLHEYDYPYQSSRTIVSPHFDDAKQAADALDKPVFIGETGISLASGCMSAEERAAALKQKFDGYLEQGAAGVLYWVVLGEPNNPGDICDYAYGNNDPPVGPVMTMIKNYQMPQ